MQKTTNGKEKNKSHHRNWIFFRINKIILTSKIIKTKIEIKKRINIHRAKTKASPPFLYSWLQRKININQNNKPIIKTQAKKEMVSAIKNTFKEWTKELFLL